MLAEWLAVSGTEISYAFHLKEAHVSLLGMGVTTGSEVAGNAVGNTTSDKITAVESVAELNGKASGLFLLEVGVLQSSMSLLLTAVFTTLVFTSLVRRSRASLSSGSFARRLALDGGMCTLNANGAYGCS